MSRRVDIKCRVISITDAAVLLDHDGDADNFQWVPLSVLDVDEIKELAVNETYELSIPEWIAIEKEMI